MHRDLGPILCIGIDKLSRKKGHVYVTNVYDLEERRLIWSGEGRSKGLNNKAKVISHRCYGFRTAKTYILALYHGLGNLSEPKLVHKFL